jgi:hypothetical protein
VGVRGGVEIVQFLIRVALDATLDWANMQDDASNAFNDFLRRPLFEELSSNPALRPLLRLVAMLYGRPSTLYDSSNTYGPGMRISRTRGVHQGCVLGAMLFAIIASRVYKKICSDRPERIHCLRFM